MNDDQQLPPQETPVPAGTETNAAAPAAPVTWESLGLSAQTLEQIHAAGYKAPTPVQAQAIPIALDGHDVIASAQTGTGKTASFVLPMIEAFAGRSGTFGLILAPTREIAQQIDATLKLFGKPRGINSCVLIGGVNMRQDDAALATYPQVIVATPGRLCDHLDRGNIWLDYIEMFVLDEADRMLDMGFSDQLSRISEDLPRNRQTMLFSATITGTVRKLAERILYEPKTVTIGQAMTAAKTVEQRMLWVREEGKNRELQRLLRREQGSTIVFTRSKDGATRVWRSLHSAGFYDATYIHSDRLQAHRESALAEFKEGKYRIMIATDVAARGLHIEGVSLVVNYDLPMEPEDYVHRIGRTGRAGATGRSITFVTPRDRRSLADIEKLIGKPIPADNNEIPREDDRGGDRGGDRDRGGGRGGDRSRGGGGRGGDRGPRGGSGGGDRSRAPRAQVAPISGTDFATREEHAVNAAAEEFRALSAQAGHAPQAGDGDEHAHGRSTQHHPRGREEGSRSGAREHAPVPGAQGTPTDPRDPSLPPRKRRRRRGGKGRKRTGPGGEALAGGPEGSGGASSAGSADSDGGDSGGEES